MSHYALQPYGCPGPAQAYTLDGPTPGRIEPAEPFPAVTFTFGHLEPRTFSSLATWRLWFERQGHTVDIPE